jgi:hypothetical protein
MQLLAKMLVTFLQFEFLGSKNGKNWVKLQTPLHSKFKMLPPSNINVYVLFKDKRLDIAIVK